MIQLLVMDCKSQVLHHFTYILGGANKLRDAADTIKKEKGNHYDDSNYFKCKK